MRNTVKYALLPALAAALIVLTFSSAVLISAEATTVDVTLKLRPSVNTAHRGGSAGETLFVDNHLGEAFTAKTCTLKIMPPTGGSTTITCPTAFPSFIVPAGGAVGHYYQSFVKFGTKVPTGTWHFDVIVGGTVNGKPVSSMVGIFAVIVL